jgi:hypothetical protein
VRGNDGAFELRQDFRKRRDLIWRQQTEELTLGLFVKRPSLLPRTTASIGKNGEAGSTVVRVGRTADEAIDFEPIDELRDVGLDAGETFGELAKRQRASGLDQAVQRGQFRQRKTGGRKA